MKKKKILIVEDSTLIQLRLSKMLRSSGYDVVGKANSYEEALLLTKKFKPDMILMDIILIGKYDGIKISRDIREFSNAGIIYLTGNSSDEMIARARKTKPLGYLIKPYNDRQLNIAIEMAFTRQELILELQISNKYLEKLSRRDPLTCLPNRRDLIEHLQHNIHRFERYQKPFSVALADIDDFKMVNDTYGHDAGDQILKELSDLISNFGRKQDIVGRWSGEEFLFILVSVTNDNGAMIAVEKIRNQIEDHIFRYNDIEIKITLTFGVSSYNSQLELDEIVKQADDALYTGKRKGKNCVVNLIMANEHQININQEEAVISIAKAPLNNIQIKNRINDYEKLETAFSIAIKAFSSILEFRDPYTASHQKRVAKMAVAIAKKMNLSEKRIKQINVAALLHDIGKMQIPADILAKPGKLNKVEFEIIKMHPQAAYDILQKIDFPKPVADIVLQHHERCDGSSYPSQLKDKDIILEAKIIAVADVLDAMLAHRPFRSALTVEEALQNISKDKNSLFDKTVVNTCLTLCKENRLELI